MFHYPGDPDYDNVYQILAPLGATFTLEAMLRFAIDLEREESNDIWAEVMFDIACQREAIQVALQTLDPS